MFIFLPEHRITSKVLKKIKTWPYTNTFLRSQSNLESWKKETCGTLTSSPQNVCEKQAICSVLTMLQNTKNGRSILEYYEVNKILHEEQDMMYSMIDCKEMEKEICSTFPTEELVSFTSIFFSISIIYL